MDSTTELIIISVTIVILVILSAFFSGSETALFSLSRARLLAYESDKSRSRRFIVSLMGSYHYTLIALILGNMFVNSGISGLTDMAFNRLELTPLISTTVSIIFAVVVLLIFGEVTPKTIALNNAEKFSDKAAAPVWLMCWILKPFIVVLDYIFSIILKILGKRKSTPLTPDEYASFLEMASAVGAFSSIETEFLESAFALSEKSVAEVMTSRIDIHSVKKRATADEVAVIIRDSSQAYLPIIEDDIDNSDYLLSAKKFFMLPAEKRKTWYDSECLVEATFVPENSNLTKAYATISSSRADVALVTDEYGGITGVLGIEDIYEQLVGDIGDEHEIPFWTIQQTGENSYTLNGSVSLYLLEEVTNWKVPNEIEVNTVNGLISEKMGRIPVLGDVIEESGIKLTVIKVKNNRVIEAKAEVVSSSEGDI